MYSRLFALALLLSGARAYGDSITTFDFSAVLQTGAAQGIITIDTAAGEVTGGNFTVNAPLLRGCPL